MNLNIVLAVICGAVALVGAFCVVFQIYQMTVIDATARGLKHPKFWGVFAMSGNNSSGLLMYLIGRRKYPIINMSENNAKELEIDTTDYSIWGGSAGGRMTATIASYGIQQYGGDNNISKLSVSIIQ